MKSKSLKLLTDFVSIQSVSTDKSRHGQILKAAEFLKKEIKSLGFDVKTYQKDNCPPLIIAKPSFATSFAKASKVKKATEGKVIGVYAHYDVQPEDPIEQWDSPPFKLTARNGKLFGRGVADDKGHIIQTLEAIRRLVETRHASSLQNNIVLIFEGEEEVGSKNFEYLVGQAKPSFAKATEGKKDIDVFYVLDMGMETSDQPEIFYGLKGLIGFGIEVRANKQDLHSGVYGNKADNPIQILAELFSKIKDSRTNKILIPHFYDKVKSSLHPSFDIHGITGGYAGDGIKTIIPAIASAKFSFRLVEDQTPDEIEKLVSDFIKDNLPKGIKYILKTSGKLDPFCTDINNKYAKATDKIFTEIFGKKTIFSRSGGSIGAVATLSKLFNKPLILTGFTLADCNIHAPNENIDEEMFWKGIEALEKVFSL
jgi:acetylornithine deacetylase/succinyl-diaminopimelate desuccinylase-like protein